MDNDELRAALQTRTIRYSRDQEDTPTFPYEVVFPIKQWEQIEALLAAEKPPASGFMTLSEGIEQGRQEGYAQGYECGKADSKCTVWLVESFQQGKSDGWWTGAAKGEGGWRTENAWAARQYSEHEAKAVAAALDYFPAPFRWSHWVATEHIFMGIDTYVCRAELSTASPAKESAK